MQSTRRPITHRPILTLTTLLLALLTALGEALPDSQPRAELQSEPVSEAHRRSRFAQLDPVYDAKQVVPPRDLQDGAPWLYGDSELETWRLHVMRLRSRAVCRHVGYPGEFHEPSATAIFRRILPAGEKWPQELHLTAVGAVLVSVNGMPVLKAAGQSQPHTMKLAPPSGGDEMQLRIELANTNGEPPGILIPDGPASTAKAGWEWSVDGKAWGPVHSFPQTASGIPPHRSELPVVELKPVAVDKAGWIDFGRTILARVSFRCEGSPLLTVGESVAEVSEMRPAAHEQRTDLQHAADGRWISQHLLAFRYLKITGGTPADVKAEAVFYPVQYRGAFACSDERLTRIWMNSAYTLRVCMNDLMLDGPKRDRLPWIGDQAMNLAVNAYTFADPESFRRTCTALGRAGIENKDINGIVDYSLWWVIDQDLFQRYFDDPAYLRSEWLRIRALLRHMEGSCDADGFLMPRTNAKTWLFIDWGVEKNPSLSNVPLQVLWYWALRSGAALADRVGDRDAAVAWRSRSSTLAKLLRERAWDTTARGWRMYVGASGKLSRHANLLAVLSGLALPEQHADIRKHLVGSTLPPAITPYMTSLEIMALSRLDAGDAILPRIEKYWGAMLDRGATTFWESYDPTAASSVYAMYGRPFANSLCHAWGSGPAALLPGEILGVRPLADGWKRFAVEPKLGRLTWAAATVPTPHGDIEVLVENGILALRVPAGTTAQWRNREFVGPAKVMEKL